MACVSPTSPVTPILSTTSLALEQHTIAVVNDTEQKEQTLDSILFQNGYTFIQKMSNTVQGAVYEASFTDPHRQARLGIKQGGSVAIKQTCKRLHQRGEAKHSGFNVIVEKDIIKEAIILWFLTIQNRMNPLYIARFVDFFETEDHFYFVMEHVGECNLSQFVKQAHQFIGQNKLSLSAYKTIVKFLFWQISVMVEYMHSLGVCHLDLCLENIVVRGGFSNFIVNDNDGSVCINPNIAVKLVDFGLAEIFHPSCSSFNVQKYGFKHSFVTTSPEMFAEVPFDGMKSDIWSAGVMLYQLLTGQTLYTIPDEEVDTGFCSISQDKVELYLHMQGFSQCFGKRSLSLMLGMLNIDQSKRIDAMDVLKSSWFSSYYQRYAPVIEGRNLQKRRLVSPKRPLPYYEDSQ
eukprot:219898_1